MSIFPDNYTKLTPTGTEKLMAARLSDGKMFYIQLSDLAQLFVTPAGLTTALGGYQAKLVSGTNLKTINGESILGSGNFNLPVQDLSPYALKVDSLAKSLVFSSFIDKSKQLSTSVLTGFGYDSAGTLITSANATATEKVPVIIPAGGRYFTVLGLLSPTAAGTSLRLMNAAGVQIGTIAGATGTFVQDVESTSNGYKVQVTDTTVKFIALQTNTVNVNSANFAIWDGPFVRNDSRTIDPNLLPTFAKKSDILVYQENLAKMLPTGYRYSGTGGSLLGGQNFTGTEKVPCAAGDVFFIGINTLGTNANVGAYFTATGAGAGAILKTALVLVSGGWTLTIPADATIAYFYLFFITTEVNFSTLLIVKGSTYVAPKLKPEIIPDGKSKLSDFTNDAGFVGNADILQNYDTLVTNVYLASIWAAGAATALPSANASYVAINKITSTPGSSVAIQGITSGFTAQTQVGRAWDASGTLIGGILPAEFVPIVGGYKYVFPAGVYMVGFNFLATIIADTTKVIIQTGAVVRAKGIKSSLLPSFSFYETDAAALAWYNTGILPKVYTTRGKIVKVKSQSQGNGRYTFPGIPLPADFVANGNTIPGVLINNNVDNTIYNDIHVYGTGNKEYSTSGTQWSPLILLFQRMIANYRAQAGNSAKNLYAVQTSLGGTSFDPVNGDLGGPWNVDTDAINRNNPLAQKLNVTDERRTRAMMDTYPDADVCVIIYIFGEGDRNPLAAAKFYQNVKNSIMYDRGVAKNPMLPVILVGVNAASTQYSPIVEQAKIDLAANVPNVKYIPVTGSTTLDGIHWDLATGTTVMNDIYNEILNNPITYKLLA